MKNQKKTPAIVFNNAGEYMGSTPLYVNRKTGQVQIMNSRGMVINSVLRADEWRVMDSTVQETAKPILRFVNELRRKNLVKPVPSFGTLTVEYSQIDEMTRASVSMDGKASADRDLIGYKMKGSPLPITHKQFEIPSRLLAASRKNGTGIDTTNAAAASRVVAEELETLAVDGMTTLEFDSNKLYGLTTEPNRLTATAGTLGGGDWGTLSNIIPTIAGAITALHGSSNNYFGPFMVYTCQTQFDQANTGYYSDGSGNTALQRLRALDGVEGVVPLSGLDDGEIVVAQMTPDVYTWWEHMGISILEWASPDGMTNFFKVIAVAAGQPKSEFNGKSGIMHITGA